MELLLSNQIACSELISEEQSMSDVRYRVEAKIHPAQSSFARMVVSMGSTGETGEAVCSYFFLPLCTIYYPTEIPI